jgi:crotonobetainyl-CoA:carnitine CoA-transferase CaiB-like acyl-CoA transferase
MSDMGLDYETLHAINPRLVMVSSQLMGSRGSWSKWLGYGPSTRPAGGMTHLWNFAEGGQPPGSIAIHPDHFVGRMGAVAALAGLVGRHQRGEGAHFEAAQVESVLNLLGDLFLKESLDAGSVHPQGNVRPQGAPWGVYRCDGEERWCAITVRDDDDWRHFAGAIGAPAWTADSRFATAAGRIAARDELDSLVSEWTAGHSDYEVMRTLQSAGVPAGIAAYVEDMAHDAHFTAWQFARPVEQPALGSIMLEGPAFMSSDMPIADVGPSPMLGEHTRAICKDVLGMGDDEIETLIASGALEGRADGQPG